MAEFILGLATNLASALIEIGFGKVFKAVFAPQKRALHAAYTQAFVAMLTYDAQFIRDKTGEVSEADLSLIADVMGEFFQREATYLTLLNMAVTRDPLDTEAMAQRFTGVRGRERLHDQHIPFDLAQSLAVLQEKLTEVLDQAAQDKDSPLFNWWSVVLLRGIHNSLQRLIEEYERQRKSENGSPPSDATAIAESKFAELPLKAIPDVAILPLGSRMPYARNPLFVGRQAELMQLAQAVKGGETIAVGQIAAATGLGGIGKTQLAVEFVHRYGQYFAGGVYWLSFADGAALPAEVAACGMVMAGMPDGFGALELETQVRLVREAWQRPLPRLLVFDNCEEQDLLAQWRPTSGGCRVLVTSRRQHWDPALGVQVLVLEILPRPQSIELLRKFRPELAADDPVLDHIADELGDLPLALHMAGNFLKRYENEVTPAQYLEQLQAPDILHHRSLQGSGFSPTGHELHVARTFALSYARLDPAAALDALALALLARAACFAPGEGIPRDLLLACVDVEGDDASLQAADARQRLVALGLVETELGGGLRLHRLVAEFVRAADAAAFDQAQVAVEEAVLDAANRLNNAGVPGPLLAWQAHLRHVTDRAANRADERAAGLCNTLGYHLRMVGDYAAAKPYYVRALAINEEVLGAKHPATALSLNNLGALLDDMGDLAEAKLYYERALAIREEVLGAKHADTARSLNNLGYLLKAQGDLAGAQPYYERALAIREDVLGAKHPSTANSLNNLGGLLQAQGDLAGAQPYLERALAIREDVLGAKHPLTASSLNNLGMLLKAQGDLAGAQPYYVRALAIREDVLGAKHADTANSLNNLGSLLQAQGDLAGAQPYYVRALAIREEVLGAKHPDTANSLNNLGSLLYAQGDLAGAQPYYARALAIFAERLGPDHPNTKTVRENLAFLNAQLGRRG